MNDIEIKEATVSNIDTLMHWRLEVLRETYAPLPEIEIPRLEVENRKYYTEALTDGTHVAALVWLDGKIIGCGGFCIQRELPSPDNLSGKCAYLMNIYVVAPYRHLRIGHDIVKWLISKAEDKGITKIYLEASKAARNLYESMGFVDMEDLMSLKEEKK